MKKAIIILTSTVALAAPTTALASGATHATPCRTSFPGFMHYLGALNTSCATARTVEHYAVNHEMYGTPPQIAGIRWTVHYWSSTETSLIAGARVVYMEHRPAG
jgi:hypothetical protein